MEQISQNPYLNHLIGPSLLSFENATNWTTHAEYYLSKADIKDYNVIDRKTFFDQSIQSFVQSYENNRKIIVDQDDYT